MTALEKIVEWAGTLPDWQDDLIRRLLTQSAFSNEDEKETINFLKNRHGLIEDGKDNSIPQRVEKGNISGVHQTGITISLKELKCICGINALPENAILPFSSTGLNAIYGDNGTGKSGYARVLKKACKARDTEEDILSNVFDEKDDIAKALFKIIIDDQEKTIAWENGKEDKDELSNISVFDAKCARIILDKKNNALYLPYGAHIFEKLVEILTTIKSKLEEEKPFPIKPEIDELDQTTEAGKYFNGLNINSKKSDIELNTKWDDSDTKKLKKLKKDILSAEINDPQTQVSKMKRMNERLIKLIRHMLYLRKMLSYKESINIKEHLESLATTEKALEKVSKISLSNEPLKGTGSNVWQILYNAAKQYSIEYAYPEKEFPNLEDNSLCVLCMQPIDSSGARERFKRFKNFMEDTTKKDVEIINKKLQTIRHSLESLQFDTEAYGDVFEEISSRNKGLSNEIKDYLNSLKKRREELLIIIDSKQYSTPSRINVCPKKEILQLQLDLNIQIKELKESADPGKLIQMKSKCKELTSRNKLSQKKKEIEKYIENLIIEQKYTNCISEIKTRDITTTGRDIVAEALSPQLEGALTNELKQLGGTRFPVYFKVTGGKGVTEYQLNLKGIKKESKALLGEILSEGEQKIIAIAGFLAELNTTNKKNPIVLDDPVSSLDHKYRKKIAKRLIIESTDRQVIIFTHDLPFLMMLQEFAEQMDGELNIKSIERTVNVPGICTDYMPWDAMNMKGRIKILKEKYNELKEQHSSLVQSDYNKNGASLYGNLRETWERLVEELLLNGVIYRFGRDIQTQRLRRVVDISNKDYEKVYNAIKKCSMYFKGHDNAPSLNEDLPELDEIWNDIIELEDYRKELLGSRKRNPRN